MTDPTAPNAARFAPLPPERLERWARFPAAERVIFPSFLGLRLEEVRTDYARMRLPYRSELEQPAGVVHGGALATLIDTTVVPAIGCAYPERRDLFTISLQLQYLAPVAREDAICEGWVEKRGRSTVFCRAEVRGASGTLTTTSSVIYKVARPR